MKAALSKVTSKGQIVIPKRLRKKYNISLATKIRWIERDEGILMIPETEDPVKAARGMLKGSGILKAYLKEKHLDKLMENRKLA